MEEEQKIETLTPEEATKFLPKDTEFIRATLRQGKVDWGWAVQNENGHWNYIIIKSKFLDYIGGSK